MNDICIYIIFIYKIYFKYVFEICIIITGKEVSRRCETKGADNQSVYVARSLGWIILVGGLSSQIISTIMMLVLETDSSCSSLSCWLVYLLGSHLARVST